MASQPLPADAADEQVRKVRTLKDPEIVESSGLALSLYRNKRLWTHNDSGGGPRLYAIGKRGQTTGRYYLENARAWDWEAMAIRFHCHKCDRLFRPPGIFEGPGRFFFSFCIALSMSILFPGLLARSRFFMGLKGPLGPSFTHSGFC